MTEPLRKPVSVPSRTEAVIGSRPVGLYFTSTPIERRRTEKERHMRTIRKPVSVLAGAAVALGLGAAGMGMSDGVAQAQTPPGGPYTWCPGDPPVETGNRRINPVRWDESICHEYWHVYHGQGNVAQNIWDGPNPPGPPASQYSRPAPPPLPPGWCWAGFLPGPCPPGVPGPRLG